jgi:hypothetical protein
MISSLDFCGLFAGMILVRILQRFTFNAAANGIR